MSQGELVLAYVSSSTKTYNVAGGITFAGGNHTLDQGSVLQGSGVLTFGSPATTTTSVTGTIDISGSTNVKGRGAF